MNAPAVVELWYVATRDVRGPELLAACSALLTPEERTKHRAFFFEKNRHEYLVTRALARAVLARRLGVATNALAFVRNEYGRPELVPPVLRFNLTNTVDLVACVVTASVDVGVDAEPLSRAAEILELATTVFTEGERAALGALGKTDRDRRAVELWTLKEAYMKARGMGMSLPVDKFGVDLEVPGGRLRFFPPVTDDASRWELTTREIEGHVIGTCVERGGEVSLNRADLAALLGVGG